VSEVLHLLGQGKADGLGREKERRVGGEMRNCCGEGKEGDMEGRRGEGREKASVPWRC